MYFSVLECQGGIEDDEDPISAAVRELRQETGIVSAEIIAEVCADFYHDFAKN